MATGRAWARRGAVAALAALPGVALVAGARGPFHPSAARTAGGVPVAPALLAGSSEACGRCHPAEAAEWAGSPHRHAGLGNPWYRAAFEEARREAGDGAARWCAGCHTPALLLAGRLGREDGDGAPMPATAELAADALDAEGVSCVVCHATRAESTVGQGGFELALPEGHRGAVAGGGFRRALFALRVRFDPEAHRRAYSGHRDGGSELCASCHKGHVDEEVGGHRFFPVMNDYDPWQGSSYSGQGTVRSVHFPEPEGCAGCHMGGAATGRPSHRFAATNTALPALRGDAAQAAAVEAALTSGWVTLDLFARTPGREPLPPGEEPPVDLVEPVLAPLDRVAAPVVPGESIRLDVVVRPHGVGHAFPGGKPDLHDVWVELEAVDGAGRTVLATGAAPEAGAHRYRTVWVDGEGRRVNRHRLWRARATASERRIEPTGAEVVRFRLDLPQALEGPLAVTARLRHRALPPDFHRWVFESLGREAPALPVVTLAEARATLPVAAPGPGAPEPAAAPAPAPEDAARWTHYGVGLALQGDLRGAAEALRTVLALTPEDPEAWANLGRLLVVGGTFQEGRDALRRALELEPGLARAHHFLGLAARNEADLDGALEHFRAAYARYPRDPLVLRQLATTHLQRNELAEAAVALEELLAVDPQDAFAHFNLARAARGLGEAERAARHQALFERYQVDETAEQHALRYLADHPHDNRERQRIHEHRVLPPQGDGR